MQQQTTAPQDNPSGRPEKIKFRIHRTKDGHCEIKTAHPLPKLADVLNYMPTRKKDQYLGLLRARLGWSWSNTGAAYDVAAGMRHLPEVKSSEWVPAITKAIQAMLTDRKAVDVELLSHTGPIYMAVGNAVLRAQVCEFIESGPRALPALRRKVTEDAVLEATQLIEKAKAEALKITTDAEVHRMNIERQRSQLQQELNNMRAEASRLRVVPEWITSSPQLSVRWRTSYTDTSHYYQLFLIFPLELTISTFTFSMPTEQRIFKVHNPTPISLNLAVPINQPDYTYEQRSIRLNTDKDGVLPHMDSGSSCQELAERPNHIRSLADLTRLQQCIAETMSDVNLNSLLTSWSEWHPHIRRKCPRRLAQAFINETNISRLTPDEVRPVEPLTLNTPSTQD